MLEFFDKYLNVKKMMEDKREYKTQMARIKKMPKDYQYVLNKMLGYMWRFAGGDGMDIVNIQYDLIDMFETGISDGKGVLEITGEDVASFCDELLRSANTYTENWHDKLNNEVQKEINKGND